MSKSERRGYLEDLLGFLIEGEGEDLLEESSPGKFKSEEWYRTAPIEEVRAELQRLRGKTKRYRSGMYYEEKKFKPSGYIFRDLKRELEEFGVPDESLQTKYVKRLMARGGYTRKQAERVVNQKIADIKEKEIGGSTR